MELSNPAAYMRAVYGGVRSHTMRQANLQDDNIEDAKRNHHSAASSSVRCYPQEQIDFWTHTWCSGIAIRVGLGFDSAVSQTGHSFANDLRLPAGFPRSSKSSYACADKRRIRFDAIPRV